MAARAMKSPTSFRIGDAVGRTRPGPGGAPGPGVGWDDARRDRADGFVANATACLPLMAGSLSRVPNNHISPRAPGTGDACHATSGYTSGSRSVLGCHSSRCWAVTNPDPRSAPPGRDRSCDAHLRADRLPPGARRAASQLRSRPGGADLGSGFVTAQQRLEWQPKTDRLPDV